MQHHSARRPQRKLTPAGFFSVVLCYLLAASVLGLGWLYSSLPDTIYVEQGQPVTLAEMPFLSAQEDLGARSAAATRETGSYNTTLALGGVVPIKTVRTIVTERPTVLVCGTPFGIKMFSDGALVVAFTDISTRYGDANPAKEAGLRLGDLIISVGGTATRSNEDLSAAIAASEGQPVEVVFVRDGEQRSVMMTPIPAEDGGWRAGMWVRDSSAGVGTMTFVVEETGTFAGLGHSISDSDTGESIALRSGEIVPCTITGYQKGLIGSPGELQGQFSSSIAVGTIRANGATGVYGTLRRPIGGTPMEIAFAQEVTTGPAEMWTTIEGDTPQAYAVEIERVRYTSDDEHRNLILHVTDPALLNATGGIVQGMSGSPIIQDGKLVGAVTHVLVNDPTRGYGIFIENMLDAAG